MELDIFIIVREMFVIAAGWVAHVFVTLPPPGLDLLLIIGVKCSFCDKDANSPNL